MSTKDKQDEQLKNVSGGHHLGGTHFGQKGGDAKVKDSEQGKGDKARPNDGKTS